MKFAFALLSLVLLAEATPAAAADASERSNATVAVFASYCLSPNPDFASQNLRASAAHLEVIEDRNIPMSNGDIFRQKNWLVPNATGTLMLTSADVTHAGLHTIGCGIAVLDGVGPAMERALSSDPRLGEPVKRIDPAPSGGVTAFWKANIRPLSPTEDAQVMLAYGVPGLDGVVVNFIFRTKVGS